ncbi:MAG: hypothetical protein EAZ24_16360 [Burkholderiales bacterium]|nr:MAG: hypothetical protein EAZ24_16360 [Burkholderiales bacterium]TAG79519.1 MAG: hypothetical protein EAZ21_10325 [Betaproteobacteria bacterium]
MVKANPCGAIVQVSHSLERSSKRIGNVYPNNDRCSEATLPLTTTTNQIFIDVYDDSMTIQRYRVAILSLNRHAPVIERSYSVQAFIIQFDYADIPD